MPEDDPILVKKLLEFCYSGCYSSDASPDQENPQTDSQLRLDLFHVADKYGVPLLQSHIAKQFALSAKSYLPKRKTDNSGSLDPKIESFLSFLQTVVHVSKSRPEELHEILVQVIAAFGNHLCCCGTRKDRFLKILNEDTGLAEKVFLVAFKKLSCRDCQNSASQEKWKTGTRKRVCGQCGECDGDAKGTKRAVE